MVLARECEDLVAMAEASGEWGVGFSWYQSRSSSGQSRPASRAYSFWYCASNCQVAIDDPKTMPARSA